MKVKNGYNCINPSTMVTTKTTFSMVYLLMFCSCSITQTKSIKMTEWLIGTWEQKTLKGSVYETWQKTDKNSLSGKSYVITGKDTIIFETIRLVNANGHLSYIPAVRDQNEGVAVHFQGKTISERLLVFENKMHDFPQVISYAKITGDSLKAEISGTRNGKYDRRHFLMKRIK